MTAPTINKGDVYYVDIPPEEAVGSEQAYRRPFVVVSITPLNTGRVIVGVPLTTNLSRACAYRIKLPSAYILREPGFTGDIKDSVALTDQIRAFDQQRIKAKVGKLTPSALIAVELGLSYVLGIEG